MAGPLRALAVRPERAEWGLPSTGLTLLVTLLTTTVAAGSAGRAAAAQETIAQETAARETTAQAIPAPQTSPAAQEAAPPATPRIPTTTDPEATEPVRLRWRLAEGDTLRVVSSEEAKQTVPIGGQSFEVPVSVTLTRRWNVEGVDGDGTATILETLERIRFRTKVPFVGEVAFDSDVQADPEPEGAAQLRALVGLQARFRFTDRGRSTDRALVASAPGGFPGGSIASRLASAEATDSGFDPALPLPDEDVSVGASWSVESRSQSDLGALLARVTATMTQAMDADDAADPSVPRWAIDWSGTLELAPDDGDPPVDPAETDPDAGEASEPPRDESLSIKEGTVSGTTVFDAGAGIVTRASRQQTMTIVVQRGGESLEAKSSIRSTTTVTRVETP